MVTLTLDNHSDADRYNIKESFEALDRQKTGRLEIDLAYTLLLGLGYITDYKKKDEFTPAALEEAAELIESAESENNSNGAVDLSSGITLETLLTVVATVRALFYLPSLLPNETRIKTASNEFVVYKSSYDDVSCRQSNHFLLLSLSPQHGYSILLYRKGMGPKVSPTGVSN
jgi:hypothetical protein